MTTTAVENLPATWDDARDVPFFRITARLSTPAFCLGASVLLASYDDTSTTPATIGISPQPERDLLPVRVRSTR